jgi:DNA-binding PadR family transcriptional regulator
MRVVLALGSEALTTKQIQSRLPDVAQATLYRAVSRLVDARVITVVEQRRRGGAMESVYRAAAMPEFATASSTPEAFVAATDAVARSLSLDAARHAASGDWGPGSTGLLRETVRLTPEQFELLRRQLVELLGALSVEEPQADSREFTVTVAAIPRATPPDGESADS